MTEDFNLSEKIEESPLTGFNYIKTEDVKTFIQKRNKLIEYWFGDLVEFKKFKKDFDKLAGKNLK